MKIDYEITVDVRGMSVEKKKLVQDAFFKLGFAWDNEEICTYANVPRDTKYSNVSVIAGRVTPFLLRNGELKITHTYSQLMELAGMTDKKQLSDLNSDELRSKLAKNTNKITKLNIQNDEIVEVMRSRALSPINIEDSVALTVDELVDMRTWWSEIALKGKPLEYIASKEPLTIDELINGRWWMVDGIMHSR